MAADLFRLGNIRDACACRETKISGARRSTRRVARRCALPGTSPLPASPPCLLPPSSSPVLCVLPPCGCAVCRPAAAPHLVPALLPAAPAEGEWWEALVTVPADAVALNFVLTCYDAYDNNGQQDFKVGVVLGGELEGAAGSCTQSPARQRSPLPAPPSPLLPRRRWLTCPPARPPWPPGPTACCRW
jgi:hypothetical protein